MLDAGLSVCAVDPNTEVKDSIRGGCGGRPCPRSQESAAHVLNHGHCCSTACVHVLVNFPLDKVNMWRCMAPAVKMKDTTTTAMTEALCPPQ